MLEEDFPQPGNDWKKFKVALVSDLLTINKAINYSL